MPAGQVHARRVAPVLGPRQRAAGPPIPAARRVSHASALWWWLVLLAVALVVRFAPESHAPPAAEPVAGVERDAFLAFVFGKVAAGDAAALDPTALRLQLERLQAAGAHSVRVEDVRRFLEDGTPLPARPVLLAFDEAHRETVEAMDPILAELGLSAVVFVSVDGLAQGNTGLVSRRRLAQATASGRWETGIAACRAPAEATAFSSGAWRQAVTDLQGWTARPVQAISCLRDWRDPARTALAWTAALDAAGLPLGFVARTAGANRREDAASTLRLVRITAAEGDPDALVRRLAAHTPRHERYVDEFGGHKLADAWADRRGTARVDNGRLRLAAAPGQTGASLTLGGMERWRDMQTTVDIAGAPSGQFWIYARHADAGPFLRLGVVDGRVALQKSELDGQTRQVAAVDAPAGPLRLGLRVMGSRALAFVNDRPLMERPAEVAPQLQQGPVTLSVWNANRDAAVTVTRAVVEPLQRRIALLDADPGDASFERLRDAADGLWAVSPRLYRWHRGRGTESAAGTALAIFAGHHHLEMLPALSVERLPEGEEWQRFGEQVLRWALAPGSAGVNLVVRELAEGDGARVEHLRRRIAAQGRELTLTARRRGQDASQDGNGDLLWFSGSAASAFEIAAASQRPG